MVAISSLMPRYCALRGRRVEGVEFLLSSLASFGEQRRCTRLPLSHRFMGL